MIDQLRIKPFIAILVLAGGGAIPRVESSAQVPSSQAVLARFTKIVDPSSRLSSMRGVRLVVQTSFADAGLLSEMHLTFRAPNQVLIAVAMEGAGRTELGFDGNVAWVTDFDGESRFASEPERRRFREAEGMRAFGRPLSLFSHIGEVRSEQSGDDWLDCIDLTWVGGLENTECYSRRSGRLMEARSGDAAASTIMRFGDYRLDGGFFLSHTIETVVTMEGNTSSTQSTIRYDFAPVSPEEIRVPASLRSQRP